MRVEAPDALEQTLPAQHFVAARDAAAELVRNVEERRVAIGHPAVERQQRVAHCAGADLPLHPRQQLHRRAHPDRPVAQEPTAETQRDRSAVAHDRVRRDQVQHDVIVVAGVEADALFGVRFGDAAHHVERTVAIERCDLDRHHVVDLRKAAPEPRAERDPADAGLQIEADERNLVGHLAAMRDQSIVALALECGEAHEPGVITQPYGRARFAHGLRRAPAHPGDHDQRALRPRAAVLDGGLEHGLVQAGFADRELGGVHAHRQPAGPGIDVVAGERALAAPVEAPRCVQSEGMRGYHRAFAEDRENFLRQIVSMQAHDAATFVRPRANSQD